MSRIDAQVQARLLKEARKYLRKVKPVSDINMEPKKAGIVLTEEHLVEWLQVFADDRIRLDGCNHATVKR